MLLHRPVPNDRRIPELTGTLFSLSLIVLVICLKFGVYNVYAQEQTDFSPGEMGNTDGDTVYLYLQSAVYAINLNDHETATRYLDESLAVVPYFAPAHIALSFIALEQGEYELALVEAQTAHELNPQDNAVYYVLAETHFGLGNFDVAQYYYRTYLDMAWANGYQPILITSMLNDNSLPIVDDHMDVCNSPIR